MSFCFQLCRLKTQSKQFSSLASEEEPSDSTGTPLASEVTQKLQELEEDYKTLGEFAKATRQKFEDVQFICQVSKKYKFSLYDKDN